MGYLIKMDVMMMNRLGILLDFVTILLKLQ